VKTPKQRFSGSYECSDKRERNQRYDAKRREEKPWRVWYKTKRWYANRGKRLRDEPLCRMCAAEGKVGSAWIVDHIKPHKDNADLFFDYEDTQSLCVTHHNRDKHKEERGRFKAVGEDGWPV